MLAWVLPVCHTPPFIRAEENLLSFPSRSRFFYLNLFRQESGR